MHLSISVTKLAVLIGSKNGQNLNPYFDGRNLDFNLPVLVELLAPLNYPILSIQRTLFVANLEDNGAITTVQTCKKA